MRKPIFREKSFYDFHREQAADAARKVEKLPRSVLLGGTPDLTQRLNRIASDHNIAIATLGQPSGGKSRKETRSGDYGGDRIERPVIDVKIPYSGDRRSFDLSISGCHMISAEYHIQDSNLVVTFPDDERLKDNVDDFVRRASENLDLLRAAVVQHEPALLRAVQSAAEQTKERIAAEQERDSKVKFKIERA
jgi:hypothetical protein